MSVSFAPEETTHDNTDSASDSHSNITTSVTNYSLSGYRQLRETMGGLNLSPTNISSTNEKVTVLGAANPDSAKPVRRRRDSTAFGPANKQPAGTGNTNVVPQPLPRVPSVPTAIQTSPTSPTSLGPSVQSFITSSESSKFHRPLFGLFGSLDEPCFDDLQMLYNQHKDVLRPYMVNFDTVLQSLFPCMTLLAWLEDDTLQLPPSLFTSAIVLWPLTTVFQLCSFIVTYKVLSGGVSYERFREALATGGLLTLGKGLLVAIVVASSRTADEFDKNSLVALRASFIVGSIHEVNNQKIQTHGRGYADRYQMLVVNIPLHSLQTLVDAVNDASTLPPGVRAIGDVTCCKILSPRAAVLCGHPLDLCRLEKEIIDFTMETGVKILKSYLRMDGPECSEYFCRNLHRQVYNAWLDGNIYFSQHDLTMEVFSPVDGHPLSSKSDLMDAMTRMLTYEAHNLLCSLGHVQGVDNILDFGPGQQSTRISFYLRWMNSNCEVICCPENSVLPKQAPSPKRSTNLKTRSSALAKCAVLNEILATITWEGKPEQFGIDKFVELNTTFLELGLLVPMPTLSPHSPKSSVATPTHQHPSSLPAPTTILANSNNNSNTSPKKAGGGSSPHAFVTVETPLPSGQFFNPSQASPLNEATSPINRSPPRNRGAKGEQYMMTFGAEDTVRFGKFDETYDNLQYYQHALLTIHGVNFITELNHKCRMDFPLFALLMCKDVAALLEYWDTLEFVTRKVLRSAPRTEASRLMSRAALRKQRTMLKVRSMFQTGNQTEYTYSMFNNTSLTEKALLNASFTMKQK